MTRSPHFALDFENICQLEGLVHVYFTDTQNRILHANKRQLEVTEDLLGVKKNDIIGASLEELFKQENDSACEENYIVLRDQLPKTFYNTWIITGLCSLELLTTKMPIYTKTGKLGGVLGISYYINKFSIAEALKLGLSNREAECLSYLLEGKTSKIIASLMNISFRTVEDYCENIKGKLGCLNRSELIFKASSLRLKETIKDSFAIFGKTDTTNNTKLKLKNS